MAFALLGATFLSACGGGEPSTATSSEPDRPNILFVVWDTVRADHLSLYGYGRNTTPKLDRWAENARVFENCLSTAPITVSSHAAMFTGLLPTESGASNAHQWLNESSLTLAELLSEVNYRTFAWSANPHISREENFTQGFEVVKHPWDSSVRAEARAIVTQKVAGDSSNELGKRLGKGEVDGWTLKAAGGLAQPALMQWLEATPADKPFFAFINYMEAHRPLIPARRFREAFMTASEIDRSYKVDVSWVPMWAFSFGLSEIEPRDLETMESVYDASLLELDELFDDLLTALRKAGQLENTIVVLTSDHGEHLGDHHMLDHQFSVFDSLLSVPLVIHYPKAFEPGRDQNPVSNYDLFPTLVELSGIEFKHSRVSGARSLVGLSAPDTASLRPRMAEFPAPFTKPFRPLRRSYPDWDEEPWKQSLRALTVGSDKLIRGSAGRLELYRDGDEERNVIGDHPELRDELVSELDRWTGALTPATLEPIRESSEEHREMLNDLGYSGDE